MIPHLSDHARRRAALRLGIHNRRRALEVLNRMWVNGYPATETDLREFSRRACPGYAYRIAVRRGTKYLIICDRANAEFITVMRKYEEL